MSTKAQVKANKKNAKKIDRTKNNQGKSKIITKRHKARPLRTKDRNPK